MSVQLVSFDTIGTHPMVRPWEDRRAPVGYLSDERKWHCVVDAARSTIGHGSSCAAMIEYSEAVYPENPSGRGCGQN